jgi:hypothetical protein
VTGITGVEIQARDPSGMSRRWGEVLAQPPRRGEDAEVVALQDGGEIRFVPERDARGEGVSGLLVAAADAEEVRRRAHARGVLRGDGTLELCGVRIRLVAAGDPRRGP